MSDILHDGYPIYQGQPTVAGGVVATVPASKVWCLLEYFVCNASNAATRFILYKVPSGGSPTAQNVMFNSPYVDPNASYPIPVQEYMLPGDELWASQPGFAVVTNGTCNSGATSVPIAALAQPLLAGTVIMFGSVAVTLTAAAGNVGLWS